MKIEKDITICFDTNIYDNTQYSFSGNFYTTFKKLKKVYPNLKVYVEPIIYNEVLSHIRKYAKETAKIAGKLKEELGKLNLYSDSMEALNIECLEDVYFTDAKKQFEEFIEFFSNEEIDKTFNYEMAEILVDYFCGLPPFENKKNKKSEFPDALIIQSLKNRFQSHENLFIVSNDIGFLEAVKNKIPESNTFKNYAECADFLNKQQEKYEEAHNNVENLVESIKGVINKQFEDLLYDFVSVNHAESLGFKIDVTN